MAMAMHGSGKRGTGSSRNAHIVRVLAAVIFVCVAFVAGFAVRGNVALLKGLGFDSLVVDIDQNPGATVTGNTYDSLSARVAEVEGILANDSLDSYDLDAATTAVLDAYVETTKDEYLRYFDPARYATFVQDSAQGYAGIGALFAEYDGHAYVVDVFPGSVAEAAGVLEGDFVVAIDGDRSREWSQAEVVGALARNEGDSVVVTWRRPATLAAEGGDEFTTTLSCSAYTVKNVEARLDDSVGIITVKQLTQNSAALAKQAVVDLTAEGATSFVLDLRDNPGGYLTQAVDIASLFVKSGVIVQIQTKDSESTKTASPSSATTAYPLVVLVNGNTAAAAEVLAAALQDNGRATLVGETTLGKGSVQVVRDLSFGGALRYTAAYYKSPLGHDLNGAGVTPSITVARGDADDNQMNLAVETAQSLVRE